MNNERLPDEPSELLALALSDLEKVERSSEYQVSMMDWHAPTTEAGVCNACMAGAVMAKTLEVNRFEEYLPSDFGTDTENKLFSINRFRKGCLTSGLEILGIDRPRSLASEIDVADYHEDPNQFKENMRDIIEALEREGL